MSPRVVLKADLEGKTIRAVRFASDLAMYLDADLRSIVERTYCHPMHDPRRKFAAEYFTLLNGELYGWWRVNGVPRRVTELDDDGHFRATNADAIARIRQNQHLPLSSFPHGVRVLVDYPWTAAHGRIWLPSTVVSDVNTVLLEDGRRLPATTQAARMLKRVDGEFELMPSGSAWRRGDYGPVELIEMFATTAIGELGSHLGDAAGAPDLYIFDGGRWSRAKAV